MPSDYNLLGVWGNVDGRDTQGLVIACSFIEVVNAMLEPLLNQKVVIDLASEYVCLGTLVAIHDGFMELICTTCETRKPRGRTMCMPVPRPASRGTANACF